MGGPLPFVPGKQKKRKKTRGRGKGSKSKSKSSVSVQDAIAAQLRQLRGETVSSPRPAEASTSKLAGKAKSEARPATGTKKRRRPSNVGARVERGGTRKASGSSGGTVRVNKAAKGNGRGDADGGIKDPVAGLVVGSDAEDSDEVDSDSHSNAAHATVRPVLVAYHDTKVGLGSEEVRRGSRIDVMYEGYLKATGRMFDSNWNGKPPLTFAVGNEEVVEGFEDGVLGMRQGGERTIIVPPDLGYGDEERKGIPAKSTLEFRVTVVGISAF